jgi:hypothetical protein
MPLMGALAVPAVLAWMVGYSQSQDGVFQPTAVLMLKAKPRFAACETHQS